MTCDNEHVMLQHLTWHDNYSDMCYMTDSCHGTRSATSNTSHLPTVAAGFGKRSPAQLWNLLPPDLGQIKNPNLFMTIGKCSFGVLQATILWKLTISFCSYSLSISLIAHLTACTLPHPSHPPTSPPPPHPTAVPVLHVLRSLYLAKQSAV